MAFDQGWLQVGRQFRLGPLLMAYVKALPFLIMGSMMIVLSHEKASKYGLFIVVGALIYCWANSKLKQENDREA